jgi:hypothetical protein
LNDKLTQSQTDELLTVVKEHFHLIVRPEQTTIQKYNWLNAENTEGCVDEQLLELLIWFLNHPVVSYKSRAIKTLIWLGNIEPNKVIPKLFEECLAEKSLISTELSAYVLQKISLRSAEVIWQFIKGNAVLQAKIVASSHFMIKHYLRQMLISILDKSREPELLNLCSKLRDTIPDVVISTGEVFLEEAYLEPIQPFS